MASTTTFSAMYCMESVSSNAPEPTSRTRIKWVRSTIGLCGEIPAMTE
jgi:hypothetical protein